MLDFRAVDSLRLRFANHSHPDLVLGPGVHGIGRTADGALGPVGESGIALVQFCVDRRGVWMKLDPKTRGVHINGRPVLQMAMLRVGDAVYVEGVELLLLAARTAATVKLPANHIVATTEGDQRTLLRGVGGQYHGRSFTLDRPRLVGSGVECDIRIDDPAFADRHARIEPYGDFVLLRDLGDAEGSIVNGEPVRDAVLHVGDQVVFDAHQRFVIESPGHPANTRDALAPVVEEEPAVAEHPRPATLPQTARRLPWLLLAALLIAAGLSALLLFGSSV